MRYRNRRPRGPWHWRGEWHGHRGRGWHGPRCGNREDLISALERYQRGLEQRAAEVAEKIRRLRAEGSRQTESPEGADATPTSETTHNV